MDPFDSPNSTTPTSTRRTQFLVCLKMTPLTQKSDRLLLILMIRPFQCQPYVLGSWVRYSNTLTFVRGTTITTHGDRNCMGHSYQRMQTFPSAIRLMLTHGGSGIEPVLLFPLPLGRNYQCELLIFLFPLLFRIYPGIPDCSAAPCFPDWQGMGEIRPKCQDFWDGTQPRPVFYQRTRT